MNINSRFTYDIEPRSDSVGGGYRLKLMDNGEEVGGGAYPVTPDTTADEAYLQASDAADEWLQSRELEDAGAGAVLEDSMIDIESLGKKPGCAVLSIGAVMFGAPGLGETFYEPVLLQSCTDFGLTIDPETVAWWMKQSDEARQAAFRDDAPALPVVLLRFTDWFVAQRARYPWCHGATFDVPILEAAYAACGLPVPWEFYDVRDTRTLYALAGVKVDRTAGTHHNALDDAKAQAEAAVKGLCILADRQKIAASEVTEPGLDMEKLRTLIANDSYAMTFQTFAQYRTALLRQLDLARRPPVLADVLSPEVKAALAEAAETRSTAAILLNGSALFINYGDQPVDTSHLSCTACGGSGHIDDQQARQGQAGRFAWAVFAKNGNVIIWSYQRDQVKRVADRYCRPIKPVVVLQGEENVAARDVLAERRRQVEQEGWTPEHDDEHGPGLMAEAAACYITGQMQWSMRDSHQRWPWEHAWWKPKDRRSNLVRAGALIVAAIECLDRAEGSHHETGI